MLGFSSLVFGFNQGRLLGNEKTMVKIQVVLAMYRLIIGFFFPFDPIPSRFSESFFFFFSAGFWVIPFLPCTRQV